CTADGRPGVRGGGRGGRPSRGGAGDGADSTGRGEVRVRSPLAHPPFTVTGVRRGGAGIVVDGELGTWASHIEIGPGDVPMLARALRGALVAGAVGGAAALLLASRR